MSIMDEMKKQTILRNAAPIQSASNPLVRQIGPNVYRSGNGYGGSPAAASLAEPGRPLIQALGKPAVTPDPTASPLAQMDPTSPSRRDPANPMNPNQGASAALAAPVSAVSTQNMGAADQLAGRYSNPLVRAAEQSLAPQNLTPADTGQGYGYGLLNSNRIAVRNAMVDAGQFKPGSGKALAALLQQQGQGIQNALGKVCTTPAAA